jgi:heme-degrading monooxygenase HmoA
MATIKRHHVPDFPLDAALGLAAGVKESQAGADGFVSHYMFAEDGGVTVIEVWDSVGQHDAWYDAAIKPQLPPDAPVPEFWEISYSNTK